VDEKSNKQSFNSSDMAVGKFNQIIPFRDPHNDHLQVYGVSDLERGRLSVEVIGDAGNRLGGTSFQTKIDGTWGPITAVILQEIPPQKFTLRLTPKGGEEILDEQIFEWKGLEKTKPITLPQELLNAEPKISIADLISKIDKSLRKILLKVPEKEFDVHDAVEHLLTGTNYEGKFTRDQQSIPTSGRSFRKPDFVFEELNLALEVKFCDSKNDVKKIIEEMNADFIPYKKNYQNIIFLVYDVGFIVDEDDFASDLRSELNVHVIIVKQ